MQGIQVERVARAFYEAEYSISWDKAPQASRNHFRDLARLAIAPFDNQVCEPDLTANLVGWISSEDEEVLFS